MALEEALAELSKRVAALTDEVQKNNAITQNLLEARTEAIESVRTAAAKPAKAEKAEKPAAEEKKPAAEEKKVEPEKPAAEEKQPEPEKPAAKPVTSIPAADDLSNDALKAHVAYFINFGSSDENPLSKEDRDLRMGKVRSVLENPKVNAKTVAEVPDNTRKAFRKKINDFIAELETSSNEVDEI